MQRIASLSNERAEQALLLLFDLLPGDLWAGGKPTLGEVDGLAEEIADAAAGLRHSLESATRQRGDLARAVLEELSVDGTLQPYVEAAVAKSTKEHMLTGLEIAGAVALILFVAKVRRVRVGSAEIEFDKAKDTAELVRRVTELINKLKPFR